MAKHAQYFLNNNLTSYSKFVEDFCGEGSLIRGGHPKVGWKTHTLPKQRGELGNIDIIQMAGTLAGKWVKGILFFT